MTRDAELLAIERAAVRGWPARDTEVIDGWLARASGGTSVRGNSIAALDWTGLDLDAAIQHVVRFYRDRDEPPRFTISDVSVPAELDAVLNRAGWQRGVDHVTMAKTVDATATAPATVIEADAPDAAWYDVYLDGLKSERRKVAPELIGRVPRPRTFFSAVRAGRVIGSGLSVVDGSLASVQCMATLASERRTGAAGSVLAAIEAHAVRHGVRRLYLQAETANTTAISLYTRFGFAVVGRYHTRDLVD
jgi:N-acetylglutamate synthase